MARKVLVVCDGCGREDLEENATNWLEATIKVGNQGSEAALVCSFDCLGRYSIRRSEEMIPSHA